MPISAIRATSTSRVSNHTHANSRAFPILIWCLEWRWRIYPAMQTARLPLLRLGRQLKGDEVCCDIRNSNNQTFLEYLLTDKCSTFLTHLLRPFAIQNPQIEIHVSPRPNRHPIIRGSYINGREKTICVRNLEMQQILQKAELLRDASGEKLKRVKGGRMVTSLNQSVRGIWSPMHGAKVPL